MSEYPGEEQGWMSGWMDGYVAVVRPLMCGFVSLYAVSLDRTSYRRCYVKRFSIEATHKAPDKVLSGGEAQGG